MNNSDILIKLFQDLTKVHDNLPDSALKTDFGGFIHYMFNNPPLEGVAKYIETRIKIARKSESANSETPSKIVVQFWERVRGMVIDAYHEAQEEND